MDQPIIRAALVGTTTAFCLASILILAACAVKMPVSDFPAMKLTSPVDAETQAAKER
jgi:predicted small lipoprotein YifL